MDILKHFNITPFAYERYQSMITYDKLKHGRPITNILYAMIQLKSTLLLAYDLPVVMDVIQLIQQFVFDATWYDLLIIYKPKSRVGPTGPCCIGQTGYVGGTGPNNRNICIGSNSDNKIHRYRKRR